MCFCFLRNRIHSRGPSSPPPIQKWKGFPEINFRPYECHIGFPDPYIPQNTTDFHNDSNGTSASPKYFTNFQYSLTANIPNAAELHITMQPLPSTMHRRRAGWRSSPRVALGRKRVESWHTGNGRELNTGGGKSKLSQISHNNLHQITHTTIDVKSIGIILTHLGHIWGWTGAVPPPPRAFTAPLSVAANTVDGHNYATHGQIFVFGVSFENVFSPKGWQMMSPKLKIQKCLDLIDCTMVFTISTCKFDAKLPRCIQTSPTCFAWPKGRKISFRATGPEHRV